MSDRGDIVEVLILQRCKSRSNISNKIREFRNSFGQERLELYEKFSLIKAFKFSTFHRETHLDKLLASAF